MIKNTRVIMIKIMGIVRRTRATKNFFSEDDIPIAPIINKQKTWQKPKQK